ncbi:MAG: TraR/DksA family transcriptional regulator [Nannocystaceae bacterium]
MDHLNDAQLEQLRERLVHELAALVERAGAFVGESADFSPDTGDRQDVAAAEQARTAAAGMAERDRRRILEVEAAIQRMDEGTYGICEVTDEPIPFGRLSIEPTARTTVEGQEELEAERRARGEATEAY